MKLILAAVLFCLPLLCLGFAPQKAVFGPRRMTNKPQSNSACGMVEEAFNKAYDVGADFVDSSMGAPMMMYLSDAASESTVLNGHVNEEDAVLSTHVTTMLDAYKICLIGCVTVVCSPPDSGKSHAGEFLIHGEHQLRPSRALKLSASNMDNFPVDFARLVLEKEEFGSRLSEALCLALAGGKKVKEERSDEAAKEMRRRVCAPKTAIPFDRNSPIQVYGTRKLPLLNAEFEKVFPRLPVLIIDDYNASTKENVGFVQELLQDARGWGVCVFLLTTDPVWATTLIQQNGGRKIKPLFGNVDNRDYMQGSNFNGVPRWNQLSWSWASLRDLVPPICSKYCVSAEEISALLPSLAAPKTLLGRFLVRFHKPKPPTPTDVIAETGRFASQLKATEYDSSEKHNS